MKKLGKKVDELLDSLKKDQSMFTMCCNDDGEFFYAYNAKADEIGAGVATILSVGSMTKAKIHSAPPKVFSWACVPLSCTKERLAMP